MFTRVGSASLLELEPDFGDGLSAEEVALAEAAVHVPLMRLDDGDRRGKWGTGSPNLAGFLIVEGALLREVEAAKRITAELVGPGDIIRPFGEDGEEDLPVRTSIRWGVVKPVVVAPLDGRLLQAASQWPPIVTAVAARCVRRTQRLAVTMSVSHMVRIADRLLVMLWQLSEHWGRVTPEGVAIDLPLTHAQLALMVGSERPSVSTALGTLSEEDLVTRLPSKGWFLRGPVPDDVAALLGKARPLRVKTAY